MDGRRRAVSDGGTEQNPAYRPTRPTSTPSHRLGQLGQCTIQLCAPFSCALVLLLVEQTVGERVLAGGVRSVGLLSQMFAADHAVLMFAEQRLDGGGPPGHLGRATRVGGRRDVAQPFGGLANPV